MRAGFTLIELIIFIAVSSVLAMTLFMSLNQTTSVVERANLFMTTDGTHILIANQLQKDFSSALEGFNVQYDGNRVTVLSFVSTNALTVYQNPKPRFVRLIYRIEPNAQKEGAYKLTRQESAKLDYQEAIKDENRAGQFELTRAIKNITIEYITTEQQKGQQKKGPDQFKIVKEWQGDAVKNVMPAGLIITISFWDVRYKKEIDYTVKIMRVATPPKTTAAQTAQPAQGAAKDFKADIAKELEELKKKAVKK